MPVRTGCVRGFPSPSAELETVLQVTKYWQPALGRDISAYATPLRWYLPPRFVWVRFSSYYLRSRSAVKVLPFHSREQIIVTTGIHHSIDLALRRLRIPAMSSP